MKHLIYLVWLMPFEIIYIYDFVFSFYQGGRSKQCHMPHRAYMKWKLWVISELFQWLGDGYRPTCSGLKGRRIEKLFQILQKCKLKEIKWPISSDNGIYRIRYIILLTGKVEYENPTLNKW